MNQERSDKKISVTVLKPLRPEVPDPETLITSLEGRWVHVKLAAGRSAEGIVLGGGPQGFTLQLTTGIGGRMIFLYHEVRGIETLDEPEETP